jgi:TonB family protein
MSKPSTVVLALLLPALLGACATAAKVEPLEFAEDIVVGPEDVVTRPEVTHSVPPSYPRELRKLHEQGKRVHEVVARGVVTREGLLKDVQILKTEHPLFAQSALEALGQWRFKPATVNGQPVAVYYQTVITFAVQ